MERLLGLFEREALSSWSAAEAEHRREEQEAESWMKEAEGYLNSLLDAAMGDFNRSYDEIERSSEKELRGLVGSADAAQRMGQAVASAARGASEKYTDTALGSAMATVKSAFAAAAKINKVHPS